MPQSLMSAIVLLSWLAVPVGLVCIVDDWFLRPQRLIAAPAPPRDTPLMIMLTPTSVPMAHSELDGQCI